MGICWNIFFTKYITIYNLLNIIQNLNKIGDYNISHHKSDNGIVFCLMYIITIYTICTMIYTLILSNV